MFPNQYYLKKIFLAFLNSVKPLIFFQWYHIYDQRSITLNSPMPAYKYQWSIVQANVPATFTCLLPTGLRGENILEGGNVS